MDTASFWQRLRQRKMVEWAIGYAAVGFAIIEVTDFMKDAFTWPTSLLRVITVVVLFGFAAVVVLAWYHGEKGHQRAPTSEIVLLAGISLAGFTVAWWAAVTTPVEAVPAAAAPASADLQLALFDPSTAPYSVAVLPFVSIVAGEANESIAEGMTEDIITELGQIEGLRVISRTSVMRYRDTEKSIPQIGAELSVGTILEGSVRMQGERVRIVAQLIDVATDGHLWAETFDRDMKDIFAVQTEVARAIASALKGELAPQQSAVVAASEMPQADPETFRLYSMGKALANNAAVADRERAVAYVDSALDRDPDFGPALNVKVNLLTPSGMELVQDADVVVDSAMAVARRAVQHSPASADARSALAFIRTFRGRDGERGEADARDAVAANPNSVQARLRYAQILYSRGKVEESRRELAAAAALDPFSAVVHTQIGEMAFAMDEQVEAERHLQRAIELDPQNAAPHVALGLVYREQDRDEEALRELETARRMRPDDPNVLGSLGSALVAVGRAEEAGRITEELERHAEAGRPLFGVIASLHASMGNTSQAIDWLRKGAGDERRSIYLLSPRYRHMFEALRANPEMARLLDSLGYRIASRRPPPDSLRPPRPPGQGSRSRSGDRR